MPPRVRWRWTRRLNLACRVGQNLARGGRFALVTRLAIVELLNANETTSDEALSMLDELVESSDGRFVFWGSVHALWREELWSNFADLGRVGLEIRTTLDEWRNNLPAIGKETSHQVESWATQKSGLQDIAWRVQAAVREGRINGRPINLARHDSAGLLHPDDEFVRAILQHALAEIANRSVATES
jgi:hypothetical protein